MTADMTRVNQWLSQMMASDQTIVSVVGTRIYADEAPQTALTPLVVYAFMGGSDKLLTFDGRLTSALYLIRAIAKSESYQSVEAVADRIDDILHVPDMGVVVRDTRITSCNREQPHQRKDSSEGVPVVYLGGFYRIRWQPALQ